MPDKRELPREPLTDKQKEVLDFILRWGNEHGYPPSLREIGTHFKIRSTNGVNDHLKALERKGYLKRDALKSRAIRPVSGSLGPMAKLTEMNEVPLVGR